MANTIITKQKDLPKLAFKTQALAAFAAIAGAVVIPQLFHVMGAVSGLGTALGETFLPMHLPIILAGLMAGPYAGAVAGVFGPLVSFALSGMPGAAMLPFMMIELAVYGLAAGLLRNVSMPVLAKVVLVQIAGRLVRAAAIVAGVSLLGVQGIQMPVIWNSIVTGLPGLILQWTLLPLLVFWINNRANKEQ